jgi:hypothetical protein
MSLDQIRANPRNARTHSKKTTTRLRPLATMPSCGHALNVRLTV